MFRVQSLTINHFRGISDLKLSFHERSSILVGENGAGKSAILDCLAIMLSRLIGRVQSSSGTGRFFVPNDISNDKNETVNTIELLFREQNVSWWVAKTRSGVKKQSISNLDSIKKVVEQIQGEITTNKKANIPLCVYYPVNRAVLDIPLRIKGKHVFDQFSAYDLALTGARRDFRLFFEWFRNREDIENENRIENNKYRDLQLEAVRKAISFFVPVFTEIKVRRSPLRMTVRKSGEELIVNQLSDGEKCLLALVGDLARRLAAANPSRDNPLDGNGVVLIDEVDLHLHPAWQRSIVNALENTFPACQFIITTHSPLIVGNLVPEKIFILSRDHHDVSVRKPETSYGQDSGRILEDIMGASSRTPKIKEKISRLFKYLAESKPKKKEAMELLIQLEKDIGNDPELTKAKTILHRLDIIGR